MDEEFDRLRADVGAANATPISEISPTLVSLVRLDRLRDERDQAAKVGNLAAFMRNQRDTLAMTQAMLDGEVTATKDYRELEGIRNALRALITGENAFAVSAARKAREAIAAQAEVSAQSNGEETSLNVVVERWAKERRRAGKSLDTHMAIARRFVELVGSMPAQKITKRDALAFKDKLLEAGDTPANVNVKLTRLRTLLNYAYDNDLIATKPAAGISVIDPDADRNRRKPFDRASLAAIFTSPVYAKGERPTQGRGEAAYWLPLLALYTGARLEELGQLRPCDIREEAYLDGEDMERTAWVIHVTEDAEDGLKIKNTGSERLVPVHPDLEALGFVRFAQAAQAADQSRIFPMLRPNKYGRLTAKWGEWFSIYKRETCDVTDSRMVFHSFRHTFKDNARHAGLIEAVQRQIMGHSGKDVADDYGDGYSLHQVIEGMKAYRVPGFKLPPPPPGLA
jgi:integrase